MPKTLLVFPPGWSPVGPYLALPVLKSYLQEVEQYKVDIVDLNVEFYEGKKRDYRQTRSN